jgi:hypothetical protein
MKTVLHPPVEARVANRRTSPPATAATHAALPAGAPAQGHAEFYPYYDFHAQHLMELPPPDRTKHPTWSTDRTIVTVMLMVYYPDGTVRTAQDNDKLPTEDYDLTKAAAHLAFRAAGRIVK